MECTRTGLLCPQFPKSCIFASSTFVLGCCQENLLDVSFLWQEMSQVWASFEGVLAAVTPPFLLFQFWMLLLVFYRVGLARLTSYSPHMQNKRRIRKRDHLYIRMGHITHQTIKIAFRRREIVFLHPLEMKFVIPWNPLWTVMVNNIFCHLVEDFFFSFIFMLTFEIS